MRTSSEPMARDEDVDSTDVVLGSSTDATDLTVGSRARPHRFGEIPSYVPAIASVVLCVAFLAPLLRLPLISDDAILRHLPETGRSIPQQFVDEIRSFLASGRMAILSAGQFALAFNIFTSQVAYRCFQIAMILLDVLLLFRLTRRLLGTSAHGYLSVLLLFVFLQTRRYHDGVFSFHSLVPTTLALIIGAVLYALKYSGLDSHPGGEMGSRFAGSRRALVLFVLCWTAGLLYYEVAFTFYPLWLVLGWRMRSPKRRPFLVAATIPTVVIMLLNLAARSVSTYRYEGTQPNLDPVAIVRTWMYQLSATAPFGYRVVGDDRVRFSGPSPTVRLLVVLLAALVLGFVIMRGNLTFPKEKLFPAVLIGLVMILGPSAMISLSASYQTQLGPFVGYIPVYFQYFGATLLAVALLGWFSGRTKGLVDGSTASSNVRMGAQGLRAAVVAIGVIGATLSADSFQQVTVSLRPTATARDMIALAGEYGLWKEVPTGSHIWLGRQSWAWTSAALAAEGLSDPVLVTESTGQCKGPDRTTCELGQGDVAVLALADRHDQGVLVVGTVSSVARTKSNLQATLSKGTVLVRGPALVKELKQGRPVLFGENGRPITATTSKFIDDHTATFTFDMPLSSSEIRRSGLEQPSPYT